MEILKRMFVAILVVTFALSAAPLAAIADTGDSTANVNKDLLDKVDRLENRIKQLELKPSGAEVVAPAAPYSAPSGGLLRASEDIQVSGYVETSYNLNANIPSTGALNGIGSNRAGVNQLRSFDRNHNSFVVNAFKLTLEKSPAETGGAGFRADLMFGEDAKLLNASTLGAAAADAHTHFSTDDVFGELETSGATSGDLNQSNVAIEQAYVHLLAPYGNGVHFYAGKFVTLLGVEVIENKDNWNASRGLIFNFGIPLTHTGVRSSYEWNDKFKTVVGVNNGADQDIDNNLYKSVEGQMAYQLTDKIKLTQNVLWSLDETNYGRDNGGDRHPNLTLDSIAGYQVTDKWGANLEYVYGNNNLGNWHGFGIWNRYQYNDWLAFNHRFEYFDDSSGNRLGVIDNSTASPNDGYNAWEMTFGVDFKIYSNLLTRLEYRFDRTDNTSRFDNGTNPDQSTFLASAIYSF